MFLKTHLQNDIWILLDHLVNHFILIPHKYHRLGILFYHNIFHCFHIFLEVLCLIYMLSFRFHGMNLIWMCLRISLCCFSMCLVRLVNPFQIIPPILIHLQKLTYQNPIYNLLTTHLHTNLLPLKSHIPTFYHEPIHLYILCHQGNKIFLFPLSYPPPSAPNTSNY